MGEQQTLFQLPFDASFKLNELKRIHFLAPLGEDTTEVDVVKHLCSCGKPKCAHLRHVTDLMTNKGKSFRYTAKSAMHKEIRRGDINAAVRWSRWVRACCGEADLKRYLCGITLEETRNVSLLVDSGKMRSDALVRRLVGSRKKWELTTRAGVFASYVGAYASVVGIAEPLTIPGPDQRDLGWWLKAFWCARLSSDAGFSALFEHLLTFQAREHGGWALRLMNHAKRQEHTILDSGFYVAKVLVEMFCGKWHEAANFGEDWEWCPADKDEVPSIPVTPDYVQDNHTAIGARRYSESLSMISPFGPMPEGIDMRWSGMLRGVLWREWAAREFPGNYLNVGWEMPVAAEIWGHVCDADGFFYKKLYERAGL